MSIDLTKEKEQGGRGGILNTVSKMCPFSLKIRELVRNDRRHCFLLEEERFRLLWALGEVVCLVT